MCLKQIKLYFSILLILLGLACLNISIAKEKKVLYWVAPMDPKYKRDKPGKSPMGMDLVPVYANGSEHEVGIKISSNVINNLGIRTALVKRENLPREIQTVGYVSVDENNIDHIHSYTDGWIKKLHVRETGVAIKKGEPLMEIYSPKLLNAQDELILALKYSNHLLIRAGVKKLEALGVSKSQIDKLRKTQKASDLIPIYATRSGIVSKLNVREGMYIQPNKEMMSIEDLSKIWVIAEVFAKQAGWVKQGQKAEARFDYLPDKVWPGVVDYVYPELDFKTRTLKVRLVFSNPELAIKPNMYASISIDAMPKHNVLTIPREALIRTGQGDRVILSLNNGRFVPVPIVVGIEAKDRYIVRSGLKAGERVVVSAQFLIDSESNLKASLGRLNKSIMRSRIKTLESRSTQIQWVGMGSVKDIDHEKHTLKIHHYPISALNWPEMTMDFKVAPTVDMKKLKRGEEIHFILRRDGTDGYQISNIDVVNMSHSKQSSKTSSNGHENHHTHEGHH